MTMKPQSNLGPVFGKDREYADLMALAEHCVRADIERQKLAPVDPWQVLDWLHTKATVDFSSMECPDGTNG